MASKIQSFVELSTVFFLSWIAITSSVSHEATFLWTEKADNSLVRIVGIPGNPWEWLTTGNIDLVGQGMPANVQARVISSRIALGFRYSTQNLFFSDRGFKEIYRTKLRVMATSSYQYNVTINPVYSGISKEVNGLAVDWLSGAIYWTDALYNWISVADSSRFEIYRHLITTGMDKPIGITVDPRAGVMFWSDWGSTAKIERAMLDGSNRKVIVKTNLHRPLGMSMDYDNNLLYWVDEWSDSIERVDLDGNHRHSITMESSSINSHVAPWGIAVFNHTAFVSDQFHRTIHIIDLKTEKRTARLELRNMPYDVMMYDESLQKMTPTQCSTLNCDHICVSMGGEKARCLCKQGYAIQGGSNKCIPDQTMTQPLWIYSIGKAICSTRINVADRLAQITLKENSDCFLPDQKNVRALAYHAHGDLLYFSDMNDMTITRLSLFDASSQRKKVPISANIASVKGIAVDWVSDNLYWTDEDHGIMVVSRLDGRYPHILMDNMRRPRGMDVNPNSGYMYWSEAGRGSIMKAHMDGSSMQTLVEDLDQPEGVSIDPREDRIVYCDAKGIRSRHTDGSDPKNQYVPKTGNQHQNYNFRSVGIYEDYYGFSDGSDTLYFGNKETGQLQVGSEHDDAYSMGDIIAYGSSNQAIKRDLNGSNTWPCDEENGGCNHLCLPLSNKTAVCKCGIGFKLDANQKACNSEITGTKFLVFTDPYHRQLYQMDLAADNPTPQGIPLPTSVEFPEFFDINTEEDHTILYYVNTIDNTLMAVNLHGFQDRIIKEINHDAEVVGLVWSKSTNEIIYADYSQAGQRVEAVSVETGATRRIAAGVYPHALAIDEPNGMLYWSEVDTSGSRLVRADIRYPDNKRILRESAERILSIAVDKKNDRLVFCTSYIVYEANKDVSGTPRELLKDTSAKFHSVVVSPTGIYISHENRKTLHKLELRGGSFQAVSVTQPVFARITDIKEFYDAVHFYVEEPVTGASISRVVKTVDNVLLVGIVGGVVALLLLVLITAIILWRLNRKPRVTKENYDTQAHDNPTYADHRTVIAGAGKGEEEDPYDTLPGAEGELPDVLNTKKEPLDDVVGGSPDPYKDMTDKELVLDVHNLVVPAEVVLDMDKAKGLGVQYKK